MSLASRTTPPPRPTPGSLLRRQPLLCLWPLLTLLLAAITGVSPMGRKLPLLPNLGLTVAALLTLGLLLPLLPYLCYHLALGRYQILGLGWLGKSYGAVLGAIREPVVALLLDGLRLRPALHPDQSE
jgi:hypothetical protein